MLRTPIFSNCANVNGFLVGKSDISIISSTVFRAVNQQRASWFYQVFLSLHFYFHFFSTRVCNVRIKLIHP